MLIGIMIFSLFLLIMGALKEGEIGGFCVAIGIIALIPPVIGTVLSISNNADDLATLRKYDAVISVQQERIESLQKILGKNIPVGTKQGNWASADTPNKTLIESYDDAVNSLAHAQSQRAFAAVNIEARKDGLFWFVVSIYGEK